MTKAVIEEMVYLAYGSQRVRVCSDGTTWQQGADRVARVGSRELQSQTQAQNRDTTGNDIGSDTHTWPPVTRFLR